MASWLAGSAQGLGTNALDRAMKRILACLPRGSLARHNEINFLGVFPADQFPLPIFISPSPTTHNHATISLTNNRTLHATCCIINTDPSSKPGKHWVAFFKSEGYLAPIEFFDSFALHPAAYGLLDENLISSLGLKLECNKLPLQSCTAPVCGHYCLLFLCWRSYCFLAHLAPPPHLSPLQSVCHMLHSYGRSREIRDKNIKMFVLKIIAQQKPQKPASLPLSSLPAQPANISSLPGGTLYSEQFCTPFGSSD